jgi:hypothetical protein
MRRNFVRRTLVNLSFAVVLTTLLPTAHGQSCSPARVAGTYGVADSGAVVGVGPRVAIAIVTLDTAGNINGKVTASLAGSVTHTTLSGTYAVNPDCTGTTSFGEYDLSGNLILKVTLDLVWDDNMRQFRFIFTSVTLANGTSLQTVINGDARKLVADNGDEQ